jgi:glycosyltransferase involved in cell wall biosynthesis
MLVGTTPAPSVNAYASMLYAAIERAGATVDVITIRRLFRRRYDIVHLHWPEWFLYERPRARMIVSTLALLTGLAWARARGARLVWTAHNLAPHERTARRYTDWFFAVFTRLVDAVISPTQSGLAPLGERYARLARAPTAVIPLGHLRGRYPDHGSQAKAREWLGIPPEANVATFFGNVRPYKNVPQLIRQFRALDDPNSVLLIGGRPLNDDVRVQVEEAAGGDERVRLHLRFVVDEDVQHYMRAADVVVLPYAETSNSFVAMVALSFDRPVLAPAIGSFPELAAAVGPSWVRLYSGDLTPEGLGDALAAARVQPPDGAAPDLDSFSWSSIAADTVALYRSVIQTDRREGEPAVTEMAL